MSKVILISVDGMRPDAFEKCSNPYIGQLLKASRYTLQAKTVIPSVTLPCHMSMFHSVDPSRHGITTNQYTPQVRPIKGIVEQIRPKTSAMFFNWEEICDLSRPDPGAAMIQKEFISGHFHGYEKANVLVSEAAIDCIQKQQPDFCFVYLGWTDAAGHNFGWMGEEYLRSIDGAFQCIERIISKIPEDYVVIVTADHGGHDRTHGTELEEDMTIPMILYGKELTPGIIDRPISIKDIPPTVTKLLGCEAELEWEGCSIL